MRGLKIKLDSAGVITYRCTTLIRDKTDMQLYQVSLGHFYFMGFLKKLTQII